MDIDPKVKTIDQYIENYPNEVKRILRKLRQVIREAAPEAEEAISYGIPTYKFKGNLVHFGGYEAHIGFYPGPSVITHFRDDLSKYKTSKGTIRFNLKDPVPYNLIKKIVKYRVSQNITK